MGDLHVGIRVPHIPPSASLARFLERLVAGGVDSLWWGDHLMSFSAPELWQGSAKVPSQLSLHTYVDPYVVMAWSADIIGTTAVGTCVTDAVRRMPATLAQTALTLTHVMKGKVILGLGAGEPANYKPYGWSIESPAGRFETAVRQIRGFLDDPGPDANGAVVALRPPHGSPGPELWLAAHGPRGLRLVGECADGWMPAPLDVDTWSAGRDSVRQAAVAVGRDPEAITMGLALDVVVQDTHQDATELLRHPAIRELCLLQSPAVFARYGVPHPLGASLFNRLIPTLDGPRLFEAALAVPDDLVRDHLIHGTVDEVIDAIRCYDGLAHIRISDLSGMVRPGGGTDRLLAIVDGLK